MSKTTRQQTFQVARSERLELYSPWSKQRYTSAQRKLMSTSSGGPTSKLRRRRSATIRTPLLGNIAASSPNRPSHRHGLRIYLVLYIILLLETPRTDFEARIPQRRRRSHHQPPQTFLPYLPHPLPHQLRARNSWMRETMLLPLSICITQPISLPGESKAHRTVPVLQTHAPLNQCVIHFRKSNHKNGLRSVKCKARPDRERISLMLIAIPSESPAEASITKAIQNSQYLARMPAQFLFRRRSRYIYKQ